MTETIYTIDAAGKTIGRVASEAAKHLMGKTLAVYTPNKVPETKVIVVNAGKLRVSEKKRLQKVYTRYSQYPGGQKRESLGSMVGKRGNKAALRKSIEGMLPTNTFFVGRMKRLTITD